MNITERPKVVSHIFVVVHILISYQRFVTCCENMIPVALLSSPLLRIFLRPQTSFTDDTNTIPSRNGARCSSAGSRCVAAFVLFYDFLPAGNFFLRLSSFLLLRYSLSSCFLATVRCVGTRGASLFIILILRFYFVFLRTFFARLGIQIQEGKRISVLISLYICARL